jgi:hypothetical protein
MLRYIIVVSVVAFFSFSYTSVVVREGFARDSFMPRGDLHEKLVTIALSSHVVPESNLSSGPAGGEAGYRLAGNLPGLSVRVHLGQTVQAL